MELTRDQLNVLNELMTISAKKGNLANAGIVLENGSLIALAEPSISPSVTPSATLSPTPSL